MAFMYLLLNSVTGMTQHDHTKVSKTDLCPYDKTVDSKDLLSDRLAIEELMRDWKIAVQKEDFSALGNMVTEHAEFWMQKTDPLTGRAALMAAFKPFWAEYKMQQNYQCREMIISGEWAFLRGVEVNTLTNKASGDVRISQQRAFSVLQKMVKGNGALPAVWPTGHLEIKQR